MKKHKQTWWDKEIKNQFNEFKSWVGPTSAQTKVWARDYIIKEGFKSIVDFGCGMCDDYFEYRKLDDINWTGVEGSEFLYNHTKEKEIPVIHANADETSLPDNYAEVAYSRHVLEHQPVFVNVLDEMIRVASKMVMHIFFIRPQEKAIVNYNKDNNLYHNTYDRNRIEDYLEQHSKVKDFEWNQLSQSEEALIIKLHNTDYRKDWYNKQL